MKVNYDLVSKRRKDIMLQIQKTGEADVNDLSTQFNVSKSTIRRDLNFLEEEGIISRLYGGAKLIKSFDTEDNKLSPSDDYIHAIAKYASQFVSEGDTIFINTSYTALLVIQYIINKRVTVITNNAKSLHIKHDPLVSIHLTGGEIRFPKEAMVGNFALNNLMKVHANKCFLGCNGITAKEGISTAILQEAEINECMINRTNGEVFILANHSKIGASHSFNSSPIDKIDYLITDILANNEDIKEIESKGVKVIKTSELDSQEYNSLCAELV